MKCVLVSWHALRQSSTAYKVPRERLLERSVLVAWHAPCKSCTAYKVPRERLLKRPSIEPCGNPEVTDVHSEVQLSIKTRWLWLVRKHSFHLMSFLQMPMLSSLSSNFWCQKSNAVSSRRLWQEWPFWKTCWWLSLSPRVRWLCRSLSRVFTTMEVRFIGCSSLLSACCHS